MSQCAAKRQLPLAIELLPIGRPRTRGDCPGTASGRMDGTTPCVWVNCKHHLWVHCADDQPGRRWTNSDDRHHRVIPQQGGPTCALDVAEAGACDDAAIGRALGVTDERARQLAEAALVRLRLAVTVRAHLAGECERRACILCEQERLARVDAYERSVAARE